MTEPTKDSKAKSSVEERTDRMSIQLNDAFNRLEQGDEPSFASSEEAGAGGKEHQSRKERKKEKTLNKVTTGSKPIDNSAQTSPGGVIGVILGLIAIGIASYAAFVSYQLKQAEEPRSIIEQTLSGYDQRLLDLQSQIGKIDEVRNNQIAGDIEALQQSQQVSLETFQQKLDSALNEVTQSLGTSGEDWLLAEVEYLIRLANQRIIMEADADGAIALFQAADDILRDSEGVAAFDLRVALANDIAQLKSIGKLDVDGIFVQLSALIGQVNLLSQKNLKFEPKELEILAPAEDNIWSNLSHMASTSVQRMGELIDYRKSGVVITPILPPQEDYYLRQNLVMKLQLAQLGLLRGNKEIFLQSLSGVEAWVIQYFDSSDPVSIAMLESAAQLKGYSVDREMPDVTASLREARVLLSKFHEQGQRQVVQ